MPDYTPDNTRARSTIKSLNAELSNLTPSSLITLFEIDLNKLMETKGISLVNEAFIVRGGNKPSQGAFLPDVEDGILRFHNNITIFNSYLVWQGKHYFPAPITAEGFESSTKGTLPQPTLSIASQSETGIDQLALLKHEIQKFGDIIGSKVSRRRTFAKYLDVANFRGNTETALPPDGYEPDMYAELPKDVYYIERKQTENKNVLVYTLSSILDLEGTKIPKRRVVANKCVWQYRGVGCWYQHATDDELKAWQVAKNDNTLSQSDTIPLLEKAGIKTLHADPNAATCGLPIFAPAVATDKDEHIYSTGLVNPEDVSEIKDRGKWNAAQTYQVGEFCFLDKDGVKFYFVCKKITGPIEDEDSGVVTQKSASHPPDSEYWVPDECSKSLTGCRLRWGSRKGKAALGSSCAIAEMGQLPFGGFPAAKKLASQR